MRALITLFLLPLFLSISSAQVYVDLTATGNNDGTSWTDAYTNLQTALDSAGQDAQLWVATGIYTPEPGPTLDSTRFFASQRLEIYGGFNGTETMIEERDWTTNITVFSGDINGDDIAGDFTTNRAENARNVLVTAGGFAPFVVDGVSILNGNGLLTDIPQGTTDFIPWFGNGILAIGDIHVRNCVFAENLGYAGGAFAAAFGAYSDLEIENCTFDNNYSVFGAVRLQSILDAKVRMSTFSNNEAEVFGGAVVVGNGNYAFEDCDFINNSTVDGIGGGLFAFQNSSNTYIDPLVQVTRSNFTENVSAVGAGFAFNNFFEGSSAIIDSCTFFRNIAPSGSGGYGSGICLQNYPDNVGGGIPNFSVDISNSTVNENIAAFAPGLYFASFSDASTLNVENALFDDNTAEDDFGAVGVFNNGAFIESNFTNVVFENNKTGGVGGALGFFNDNDDGPLEYSIDSCTFENNNAIDAGGAIWSSVSLGSNFGPSGAIHNTTFSENIAEGCCGAILSNGESLLIDQSAFIDNTTDGIEPGINGGGAIALINGNQADIQHSLFDGNESGDHGAAIMIVQEAVGKVNISNSVLTANVGNSTIFNSDSLWLTNVTMLDNDRGVFQATGGHMQSQNSIHSSQFGNYENPDSTGTVVSLGGNLSADGFLSEFFTGFGSYADFNNASSELTIDLVPTEMSPCVDAGNPDGIVALTDYAGADRIQGASIDIGALESAFNTPIRELNALKINVYPNPFASILELSNTNDIEQIRLLDSSGKYIQSFPIENTLRVNSELAAGVYYLEVVINGRVYFKKLSKT